ncbi:hypothetical protein JIN86_08855 [Lysinibacillus sp. HST-98]|uniref:hypothetical protein n=1 Tax=Lysinibacillus sp. HST-98 TaxID=2800419 RepID=UPI0019291BA6|nr:hypothetical protein [Lysinibacillus sp. HST-98]MBL3729710.1 hypothetical protein [Lysinibacillus sp. HST-98]
MKHVSALDISKGKSTVPIYDGHHHCDFEGVLHHTRSDFDRLLERMEEMTKQDGQAPDIVFEATDIQSKPVEAFFKHYGPLEANLQMATMRRNKTDITLQSSTFIDFPNELNNYASPSSTEPQSNTLFLQRLNPHIHPY